MHRRELSKDVSIQELLYYRKHGFWNSEIAKLLDITTQTVKRYIGSDGGNEAGHLKTVTRSPLTINTRLWYNESMEVMYI